MIDKYIFEILGISSEKPSISLKIIDIWNQKF